MNKQLKFTYDNVEYTLEFTRKSVETMERNGFKVSEITEKPMTTLPALFAGSFLAHHKYVKQNVIDDIYAHLGDKEGLIGKLAEMYNEPILTLIEDPEEGNLEWTTNW